MQSTFLESYSGGQNVVRFRLEILDTVFALIVVLGCWLFAIGSSGTANAQCLVPCMPSATCTWGQCNFIGDPSCGVPTCSTCPEAPCRCFFYDGKCSSPTPGSDPPDFAFCNQVCCDSANYCFPSGGS